MVLFLGSPSPHQCHCCHGTIQDVRSSCVHGAICARRIDAGAHGVATKKRAGSEPKRASVKCLAFIAHDACWSLVGVPSQLQKRGSDCAVKKMIQS